MTCGIRQLRAGALGQKRDLGVGMKPSAMIGLSAACGACGDSRVGHVGASGPHGRRLVGTRPGDLFSQIALGGRARRSRSGIRSPRRTWTSSGNRQPALIGLAADGTVNGKGKLVWRVRGSASYDPKTIYSALSGDMRDGRPNGHGRLEIRSGEVFEGGFVDGALDGKGIHVDAERKPLRGRVRGRHPRWRWTAVARTGEIFKGEFRGGLKHGHGETRLAGGTTYDSQWDRGKEIGANGPRARRRDGRRAAQGAIRRRRCRQGRDRRCRRPAHDAAIGHAATSIWCVTRISPSTRSPRT